MKQLKVIGDMLEDDVECIHLIAAKIEWSVTCKKNKNMQALSCSKIVGQVQRHKVICNIITRVK
jgi:hypothetical protein